MSEVTQNANHNYIWHTKSAAGQTIHYLDDLYHREDGPAIEGPDGHKGWFWMGQRHRIGGPAVEEDNGYKAYYEMGELHRLDGPAIERANGDKLWFIEGRFVREELAP